MFFFYFYFPFIHYEIGHHYFRILSQNHNDCCHSQRNPLEWRPISEKHPDLNWSWTSYCVCRNSLDSSRLSGTVRRIFSSSPSAESCYLSNGTLDLLAQYAMDAGKRGWCLLARFYLVTKWNWRRRNPCCCFDGPSTISGNTPLGDMCKSFPWMLHENVGTSRCTALDWWWNWSNKNNLQKKKCIYTGP